MKCLALFCVVLVVAEGARPTGPVVYSYAGNVPEATGSGSYDAETTSISPSASAEESDEEAEEEVTEIYKEPEKSEGGTDKELLQPRFFAYSDNFQSGQTQSGEAKADDEKYTKGGGQEHAAEHDVVRGNKGDKGFKDLQKYAKGQKGLHDKETHKGKYTDTKGMKGKKKEEGGHFGLHQHAEKGQKAAKYGESGEHTKGHHTKGEHNIHKKDEYVKKHEFYDEHHEGGEHEKNGGFHQLLSKKKGTKKRRGHRKSSGASKRRGKSSQRKKAQQVKARQGHSKDKGHVGQFANVGKFTKKSKNKKKKKWDRTEPERE